MSEPTITTETPETRGSHPLKSAADAMSTAVQAARDGATDARDKFTEMMPAVSGFFGRLTYTTCYAVSYGVVFPALFVAHSVPKDNALVHGLVDGAQAARDAIVSRGGFGAADGSEPHHDLILPGDAATV